MGDLSKIAHFFRLQKDRSLRQLLHRPSENPIL
jgi:hypothetical protein